MFGGEEYIKCFKTTKERERERETSVCAKRLSITEDLPHKKIINCELVDLKILENTYTKLDVNGTVKSITMLTVSREDAVVDT